MNEHERTVLKVEVEPSLDRFLDEVGETIEAQTRGGKPTHHPFRVSFHSREELHRVLSETNLALLEAIAEEEPSSIRELARLVGRDVRRVHDNVTELERLQLIDLEPGEGGAKRPTVWYDELEISVPLRSGDADAGVPA